MDAGELHPVDGADGAGEFAFQGAEMVDVLDEAGGAEGIGLVEDLVADPAALGQAGFSELHPQPGHFVLRHHEDGAVIAHLVGDGLAFQLLDDARGVLIAEVGEQGGHLRRRDAHDDKRKEADQGQRHGRHRRQSRCSQRSQKSQQRLQSSAPEIRL